MTVRILIGDARKDLRQLPEASAHCVVTSPPYWGLRDYGVEGQIGLEETPQEYVETLVKVFRDVARVLRDDGTAWVNLGDSYFSDGGHSDSGEHSFPGRREPFRHQRAPHRKSAAGSPWGLKPKDLCMLPFRLAMALQADGWYVRKDIVWAKPNGMPEAVKDRPVSAHEYIFLLAKSPRYFYDHVATMEPASYGDHPRNGTVNGAYQAPGQAKQSGFSKVRTNGNKTRKVATEGEEGRTNAHLGYSFPWAGSTRLKRDVWTVTAKPFPGAHFATFPPDLVEPCILAGTSAKGACPACGAPWVRQVERVDQGYDGSKYGERVVSAAAGAKTGGTAKSTLGSSNGALVGQLVTTGWEPSCACGRSDVLPCTVLDPFGGAGTTGMVADRLGRDAVLLELNPLYADMTRERLQADAGMLAKVQMGAAR